MKKIYYVRTNGYDMLVSVDGLKNCRYMTENECFPSKEMNSIMDFLENDVEDDSSWDDDCSYEQLFNESNDIIAEIEKDI